MGLHFTSTYQEHMFRSVLRSMGDIGYTDKLLRKDYQFDDYFGGNGKPVFAPAVGFGQAPYDYAVSCFAVALANGENGKSLIARYRSLGAPLLFEVTDDNVIQWRVSAEPTSKDLQRIILPSDISRTIAANAAIWKPQSILRSKGLGVPQEIQLDFVDCHLIPALERHVRAKLDPMLRGVLAESESIYLKARGELPDFDGLVRLVFRVLTSKAMHDKGVEPFASLAVPPSPRALFDALSVHYADSQPLLPERTTQKFVIDKLWGGISFAHLSVESLAFVWENTLVNDELRETKGIHSTPPAVAHYVANRLIDSVPIGNQRIVEPCCGTGTFLVASMHRMRTLLPETMTPRARHTRFVHSLIGFDTEDFGLEIAHACLTLADFPNPNGWTLRNVDVFEEEPDSRELIEALSQSRFVLCNPPFEDFNEEEQDQYSTEYIQKPAALLSIVLENLHSDGEIGFVLPYQAMSGRSYRALRAQISQRFQYLEVVQLPEGVFQLARFPSILLIAKGPVAHDNVSVRFSSVTNADDFLATGNVAWTTTETKTIDQCSLSLAGCELQSLWTFLDASPKLDSLCEDIARGVEWDGFDRDTHISATPKRGFVPGFDTVEGMAYFEPPPLSFLCTAKEFRRRNAWNKDWRAPKVVCNAVRKSSSTPWRICACPVHLNLMCTQNFTVIWPCLPWTPKSIAAVLNGPVASAFATCHEPWKHIKKSTFSRIPFPNLDSDGIAKLDKLVAEYEGLAVLRRESFGGMFESYPPVELLQDKMREIDKCVLSAYRIPSDLLTELIDYFGTDQRPVPFPYTIETMMAPRRTLTQSQQSAESESEWKVFAAALEEDRH